MVVAKVNGYKIGRKEYEKELNWIMQELHLEEANEELRKRALNQLIDAVILLNKAKNSKIKVSKEEIETGLVDLKVNYSSEEEFEEMINSMGITVEKIKERIKARKLIRKYIDMKIEFDPTEISDEQLALIFQKNQEKFKQEESIHAHHLLIDDKSEKGLQRARFIKNNIHNADDFLNMEKLSQKSQMNVYGGDLGYFARGKMVKEFENVAFSMAKGNISEPIKTEFGWHIIYIEDIKPERIPSFDEVKQIIKQRLLDIDKEMKIIKHLKKLRSEAEIEILDENLK